MASSLLQDLAVILLVSGVTAMACHRLNQPKLVGYVVAGLLIGPYTPPFAFIRDEQTIRTLGELGIIFLMFSLGLDFNLRKMRHMGATAIVTAILDVSVMVWLGFLLGRRLGWTPVESLFLGAILCDSSTTILAKILQELGRKSDRFAQIAIGITLVEDVLAVVLIAVLTGVAMTGTVQPAIMATRLWQLALFMGVGTVAGLLIVPRLLDYIHRLRSDELLVVTLVGLCFGMALLAAKLELSMALGAVLIGAIASESLALDRVARVIAPLRHVFSAVFFVTIGLRLDPSALIQYAPTVGLAVLLILVGKFTANSIGVMLTGNNLDTALRVGAGMAQVGEFAFIISALALSLDLAREEIYQIGVAAAVVTTLFSPYLIRGTDRLTVRLQRWAWWRRWDEAVRFYSQWMERIGQRSADTAVRKVVRRALLMVVVNIMLISGIFGVAGYIVRSGILMEQFAFVHMRWYPVLLWLTAAALSLPLYVVTFRKLNALAMILTEATLPTTARGLWPRSVRMFLNHAINVACGTGLALLTFILSSALLPSIETFALLGLITVAAAVWARTRLSKLYARAEQSLQAVLSQPPSKSITNAASGMPEMSMESVDLPKGFPVGHTLRTLAVRAHTGANVVALDRGGQHTANPDPDLALEAGDRLLLLGSSKEIQAARHLLSTVPPPSGDG